MKKVSRVRLTFLLPIIGLLLLASTDAIQAQPSKTTKKNTAAKIDTISGALLQKTAAKWLPVKEGQDIAAGATLVSFPKTQLHSANGAVEMLMLSDVGKRGVYPILETAVVVRQPAKVDLDITFQRGLIVLTNQKKEGAAKVRLRIRDAVWNVNLNEPGTKVVAELYSQHLPGLPTLADLKVKEPLTHAVLLVIKGNAFLEVGREGLALSEPPGQSLVMWDNLQPRPITRRLDKLPEVIRPADAKEAKIIEQINTCISCLMTREVGPALDDLVNSKDKVERLVGVTMMGGLDDLPRLLDALANPQHADVREHAVLVLRNWKGRDLGKVKQLYSTLIKDKKYTPVQALTILQLLFGFNHEQQGEPSTYQMLVQYLNHSQLPVRQLAHWHLVRLAPTGSQIAYDAAAGAEQRQAAMRQWHKLIPPGELPPPSGPVEKN